MYSNYPCCCDESSYISSKTISWLLFSPCARPHFKYVTHFTKNNQKQTKAVSRSTLLYLIARYGETLQAWQLLDVVYKTTIFKRWRKSVFTRACLYNTKFLKDPKHCLIIIIGQNYRKYLYRRKIQYLNKNYIIKFILEEVECFWGGVISVEMIKCDADC